MIIALPPDALVLLVGPSGAGKSSFAARHFAPTEVLSSDAMRAIVADDPMDQAATEAAFELLHTAVAMRLSLRRLAVVDATNVEGWAREKLLSIGRRARRPAHAIVFDLPLEVCLRRNLERDNPRPAAAIRRQHRWMTQSLPSLANEGLDALWTMSSEEEVDAAQISRVAPVLSS
ncbi:MAG TPA: AAA family ATPase [Candidatus Limnocylindria bacterium]